MATFALTSDISIGDFRWSGVHEVHIHKSMMSLYDSATITLPAIASVRLNGGVARRTVMSSLFNEGDGVSINLGYNGNVNSEFVGFVKRLGTGMPLDIECEGYVRQLRLNVAINKDFTVNHTSARALLALATKGTDIEVVCPVDFPISGITLVDADGVRICEYIQEASDHTVTVFFIEPRKLWCGLVYTAYGLGNDPFNNTYTVDYKLGFNCLRDNGMKERIPDEPVEVHYQGKLATGNVVMTQSKDANAKRKLKGLLNHVPDEVTMKKFADEKRLKLNYTGYEGKLTAFLDPYAFIGMRANIVTPELPKLDGVYLIDGMEVRFGQAGARRIVGIGPKLNVNG